MPLFLVRFWRYETTLEGKRGREIESWEDTVEAPDAGSAIGLAEEIAAAAASGDEEVHFCLDSSSEDSSDADARRARFRKPPAHLHAR